MYSLYGWFVSVLIWICDAEFGHFIANGRIFYMEKRPNRPKTYYSKIFMLYSHFPTFIFSSHTFSIRFNVVISIKNFNGFIANGFYGTRVYQKIPIRFYSMIADIKTRRLKSSSFYFSKKKIAFFEFWFTSSFKSLVNLI